MKICRAVLGLLALTAIIAGCGSGQSVVGTYRVEQENNALGEGAEKGELVLSEDKHFEITMGQLKLKEGTYVSTGATVELSESSGKLATTYKVQGSKLTPMVDGKEIVGWRFIKK